ncbi:MAG: leucine--tRNA ligase [Deltaproteobacteria bacterium]|nr:leucine--tRNA ligase [Deltaproteobacteria bacterium]
MPYDPNTLEPKWQAWWEAHQTFAAKDDFSKPKFYALSMFPYPSGKGLHVGHPASYIAPDVMSRKRRAQGFNVLHPMGYDAFGLPAEQKAIDEGVAPQVSTAEAVENFRRQLKMCGFSYDWTREISTADPKYYKWTQWIFTELYRLGLAYEADSFVNWCPELGTVLANDEVIDGKSERGGHPVIRQRMRQWMLRQTAFAQKLLDGIETLDWPEASKTAQREYIGRSVGAEIDFEVVGRSPGPKGAITVFTTRPDTLFGATYLVLAPEHPLVEDLATPEQREAVTAYQARTARMSEIDRQTTKEKTGVDTGARAINPATGEEIPIWIADYVIFGYGTGAIMAVPAHDERDFAFAKAMNLPIVEVIRGGDVGVEAYTGEGEMVNSGAFDGTSTEGGRAIEVVIAWLEKEGKGRGAINFKMRDWVFARQRYWGEPIPVLKKGAETVRALRREELPVVLPEISEYKPTGTGQSPLSTARDWLEVQDADTGESLQREVDTMPGSAGSSWYFLRYCDPHNEDAFCSREKSDYWMPVDLYVGGPEHLRGHLMYSRMWQRVLSENGYVRDAEPFPKLRHQGMIQAFAYYDGKHVVPWDAVEERGGKYYRKGTDVELVARIEKMSKRKGNVVNPDEVIREYGADAMRVYICFLGPLDQDKPWDPHGITAQHAFLKRVWRLYFDGPEDVVRVTEDAPSVDAQKILHKAIKKVSEDIEKLALNTAISALHVATRDLAQVGATSRAVLEPLIQLVAPFAPHIAEEIWTRALGHADGLSFAAWPVHDEALACDETIKMGVQILGKTRGEIEIAPDADETTAVETAKANPNVARYLEGKAIVRVVYKAGRILNFIVK